MQLISPTTQKLFNKSEKTLVYDLCDSYGLAEAQAILHDVPINPGIMQEAKLGISATSLRKHLQERWKQIKAPIFGISSEVFFDLFAIEKGAGANLENIILHHGGRAGVLVHTLILLTSDGSLKILKRDTPGTVTTCAVRGEKSAESVWIPNGFRHTLKELQSRPHILTRKKRLLFDLASLLGLTSANDMYEAHITVAGDDEKVFLKFQQACLEYGIKAIHVELPYGRISSHFITGSFHFGPLAKVKQEVDLMAKNLQSKGFEIRRMKLEALLGNESVPNSDDEARRRPSSNYFEFHVKVSTLLEELAHLERISKLHGAHLSRTSSHILSDGREFRFITLRTYGVGKANGLSKFNKLLADLRADGFHCTNILHEYTVFDSHCELDDGWYGESISNFCGDSCAIQSVCPFLQEQVPADALRILR